MLLKSPGLEIEWKLVVPEVRLALHDLDEQIDAWGMSPLVVTDLMRTPAFYGEDPPSFSYHYVGHAADFQSKLYPESEKQLVLEWLRKRCPSPDWDALLERETKKRAEHFHLELNDRARRQEWELKRRGVS